MAKPALKSPKGPTQRQLRVGELIRHELAAILSRGEIHDPALARAVISVTQVRLSPDLKLATCYIRPLGGTDEKPIIAALTEHKKQLRTEIAHRINLKFSPELRFRRDEAFDEALRIDRLIYSPKVQRDLAKPAPRDEDEA